MSPILGGLVSHHQNSHICWDYIPNSWVMWHIGTFNKPWMGWDWWCWWGFDVDDVSFSCSPSSAFVNDMSFKITTVISSFHMERRNAFSGQTVTTIISSVIIGGCSRRGSSPSLISRQLVTMCIDVCTHIHNTYIYIHMFIFICISVYLYLYLYSSLEPAKRQNNALSLFQWDCYIAIF